ncbi:hypothetical protein C8R45DRAFT_1077568 [Mycena sanguinolenta]|nr:hypothetical protein C8R45DRAFT_1077568 [Mycena sanguinolenta]
MMERSGDVTFKKGMRRCVNTKEWGEEAMTSRPRGSRLSNRKRRGEQTGSGAEKRRYAGWVRRDREADDTEQKTREIRGNPENAKEGNEKSRRVAKKKGVAVEGCVEHVDGKAGRGIPRLRRRKMSAKPLWRGGGKRESEEREGTEAGADERPALGARGGKLPRVLEAGANEHPALGHLGRRMHMKAEERAPGCARQIPASMIGETTLASNADDVLGLPSDRLTGSLSTADSACVRNQDVTSFTARDDRAVRAQRGENALLAPRHAGKGRHMNMRTDSARNLSEMATYCERWNSHRLEVGQEPSTATTQPRPNPVIPGISAV